MPPAGVKKGTKRARQYEHIKESLKEQGRPEGLAEEIAARTVNKERARAGEHATPSRLSAPPSRRRAGAADSARVRGVAAAPRTSCTRRRSTSASPAAPR